ncbi:probable G-protein coupled receptor 132 [Alligator sinensis]|uniref:Probable G-protein coupled receptor 132 n=1 Tax=Alligator sinensis TaxID=38654 RepID=A0A1U7SNN7_ALLSI|nr:probable G-protein coupled receptor 132 [Alligator sinensis]XP_025046953.1 probable G-protein coupled receptor 132 [Alligator sinensis]QKE59387.1 putative G-protein coupled receptor 132 [Alligator sinensis]
MNTADNCSCPMAFNTTKYFLIPIYSVVIGTGLPLNFLAFWVLVSQIKKAVVLSVFVMNLVVADLLQTLTLPFWIYYSHQDHRWDLGEISCKVVHLIFLTNFYAKNGFLCLIAAERYLGLVHPLHFHGLQTMRSAAKVSAATWLMVIGLCSLGNWLQNLGSNHCYDCYPQATEYIHFRWFVLGISFLLPCFFMGFCNIQVLCKIRQVSFLEQEKKQHMCWFMSLIIISFFLLFLPYQVIFLLKHLMKSPDLDICPLEEKFFTYSQVAKSLATLGNITDPLLYILLLEEGRAELRTCFRNMVLRSAS